MFALCESRDGSIWFGTRGGLNRLKDGVVTNFTEKDGLLSEHIQDVREDLRGVLWIATDKGLCSYSNGQFTPHSLALGNVNEESDDVTALLTLINDILDFSKIESRKLDIEYHPFDLRSCIEDALDLFVLKVAEKQLDLAADIPPAVPQAVLGDVTRLRQIIVNLVSNAVKFTSAGEILLSVKATPLAATRQYELQFAVRDTGIGIPADKVDRLFQSFTQADSSTTRKFGGTGLGLAISKQLCELMGGKMWIESEEGSGTTFFFTLVTEAIALPHPSTLADPMCSNWQANDC